MPARAGLALTVLLSTAVSTSAVAGSAVAAPGSRTQRGSAYAGSTLRDHDPAAAAAANTSNGVTVTNTTARTLGVDVSSHQTGIDWNVQWNSGVRFAYVKATEGTYYTNSSFPSQYGGSAAVGMVRGAYHFGIPNEPAVAQADYFIARAGKWTPDGKTLPPALDIEYNPYGAACYGLSQPAMVSWLRAFANEVHKKAGRYPVIYTTTNWWTSCTGNSAALAKTDPIWIANWSSSPGTLPAGWKSWRFWQYQEGNSQNPNDPDRNVFNGGLAALKKFANNKG